MMLWIVLGGFVICAIGIYILFFVKPSSATSPEDQLREMREGTNLHSDPITSAATAYKYTKVAEAVKAKAGVAGAYSELLQHEANVELGPERQKTAYGEEKVRQETAGLSLTLIEEAKKLGIDVETLNQKKLNEWATDDEIRKDDAMTLNYIQALIYKQSIPLRTAEYYMDRINSLEDRIFRLERSNTPRKLKKAQISNLRELQQLVRTNFYDPATERRDSQDGEWSIPEGLKGPPKGGARSSNVDSGNKDEAKTETSRPDE
jgi:hypothetical protein